MQGLRQEQFTIICLNRTEMSMVRLDGCVGLKLNERKNSEENMRTLRIGTSQFDDQKKSRLRWFGHVEQKDDNDWVKRCIMDV